ncbi:Mss4-like protein [Crepidotus variabilis]|uniref:Mss4-like protein n=1 Tax=Crepidotus variabilis TaxID=179855 RepID=A0A9P6JQC3_9AGAR|nr:Mss4-like protein [Crepidotus variabilis]
MPDNNFTYIEGSCHCELNCFSVAFQTAQLPISTDLCHCNTCRHASGQLAVEQVNIEGVPMKSANPGSRRGARSANGGSRSRSASPNPSGRTNKHTLNGAKSGGLLAVPTVLGPVVVPDDEPLKPLELNDLVAYKSSPKRTRYFCRGCSSHLFSVGHTDGQDTWCVGVGALDDIDGIVQVGYHMWLGDTLDGGIADQLPSINGVELPRYKDGQGSDQVPIGWKADETKVKAPERLLAYCHCRAVQFALCRPSEQSSEPTRAYPDLLYPYDVTRLSKVNNSKDEKWWLRASNSKYLAGHCMCTFCRLASGFDVQSWGFVPLADMVDVESGKSLNLEADASRPKGLKRYISSPGRYREFCGTCGASVFWWDAGVPDLVDVSMGLFDEKGAGGARAEDWFEWCTTRVSFEEKANNKDLAKGLGEGLKATIKK